MAGGWWLAAGGWRLAAGGWRPGGLAWHGRQAARDEAVPQATLFARVLAGHASRSLGGVDLALTAASGRLGDLLGYHQEHPGLAEAAMQRTLADVASRQPLIRSLSLVDAAGRVQG